MKMQMIPSTKAVFPLPTRGQGGAWYAIRTRAQHEKVVRDRLARFGFEQLLPTCSRVSHWHDRKKIIETPLFSGYCFARFMSEDRVDILQTPGVAYIVGRDDVPEAIAPEEIESLRKLAKSGVPFEATTDLHEGDPVEIIRGPLAGIRGKLVRKDRGHYVLIGVHVIRQGAIVKISADDIVAVEPSSIGLAAYPTLGIGAGRAAPCP
jgi:transcription antitermination factor NusG